MILSFNFAFTSSSLFVYCAYEVTYHVLFIVSYAGYYPIGGIDLLIM